MRLDHMVLRLAAAAAIISLSACGGDEPTGGGEDHTPVSYTVLVNDVPTSPPFTLVAGQTLRIRLKFLNAAGEDLDDVESGHFAGLTFNPASLATVARVADHNYQFDVTGGTAGTGTVQVSYGHDEAADEHSFDPVAVTVEAAP
jgi:hypothetical protein